MKAGTNLKGIEVVGDDDMIKSIQGNPLTIGFCNFFYALDTVSGDRSKDIQSISFIDLDFDKTIDRKEVPSTILLKAHHGLFFGLAITLKT